MEGDHFEHMFWKYDTLWTYCARSNVDVFFITYALTWYDFNKFVEPYISKK